MKNMQQVNGKTEEGTERDLRNILGIREKNPYYTKDEEVLREKLEDMSMIDLQRLAIEAGTSARGSAPALKKKIIQSFRAFCARSELQEKNRELGKTKDPFTSEQREKVQEINVSD